jgi:hypothetical protein
MLADIQDNARVYLELDFYDDGVVDYSQELGHIRWKPVVYMISTPEIYEGIRFRLRKTGEGRARMAQIVAVGASDCAGPALNLPPKSDGAGCKDGSECESGYCTDKDWLVGVCSTCVNGDDCGAGYVCGREEPDNRFLDPYRTCMPLATRNFGQLCSTHEECSTGTCCQGVCSTCCFQDDCPEGTACARGEPVEPIDADLRPALCRAENGNLEGGQCLSGGDCTGGGCTGGTAYSACESDGRSCSTDEECPPVEGESDGACLKVGYYGGVCN